MKNVEAKTYRKVIFLSLCYLAKLGFWYVRHTGKLEYSEISEALKRGLAVGTTKRISVTTKRDANVLRDTGNSTKEAK